MEFRSCGDCNACCEGLLYGNAYGNVQTQGHSCKFLVDKKCSIYSTRPKFCSEYQCAWTQGLLDESMRPDNCGLLVTVSYDTEKQKQFLHVTETKDQVPLESYLQLNEATTRLGTHWVLRKHYELQT